MKIKLRGLLLPGMRKNAKEDNVMEEEEKEKDEEEKEEEEGISIMHDEMR